MVNFIEDVLLHQPYNNNSTGVGFIPGNELETALKNYINKTSDGELRDIYESLAKRTKGLQSAVLKCLYEEFEQTDVVSARFSKEGVYPQRPMGLKNVILRPEGQKASIPNNARPFQLKEEEEDLYSQLPGWFEADPVIRSVLQDKEKY